MNTESTLEDINLCSSIQRLMNPQAPFSWKQFRPRVPKRRLAHPFRIGEVQFNLPLPSTYHTGGWIAYSMRLTVVWTVLYSSGTLYSIYTVYSTVHCQNSTRTVFSSRFHQLFAQTFKNRQACHGDRSTHRKLHCYTERKVIPPAQVPQSQLAPSFVGLPTHATKLHTRDLLQIYIPLTFHTETPPSASTANSRPPKLQTRPENLPLVSKCLKE